MDRQQELKDYINRKQEALEFWRSLRTVVKCENKIKQLETEISDAKSKLEKERGYK